MKVNTILEQNSVVCALAERFRKRFGTSPQIFRAPDHVNLIGEHTDYNDGYVMPAAIDSYWVAGTSRTRPSLRVYSNTSTSRWNSFWLSYQAHFVSTGAITSPAVG